ncbi:purine-cytosine permease family protein [Pseudalkalibacillus decolorationis]|uniref:purine-cytosine permease family protein n=1 Tax=Pseudalkalibacillus decolorationis TaxID=163879 RepID=UPI002148C594|nr:cytosine permease [Pseudalkalibacillus decolorationis]
MKVEKHFIEHIPENERHGNARSLFTIWFGANMQILTVVTGALAVVFGLNLFWSVAAILLGNLVGAIFMASHSAQGPVLGIPQMIQSRAQFGTIGAIIPIIIVIFMYVGFFASNAVLGAQAAVGAFSLPMNWGILLISIGSFVIALIGYDLIHSLEKYLSILFAVVYLFVSVIAFRLPLPVDSWSPSPVDLPVFLLSVSIFAAWQLVYAPYVADYSRYLPKETSSTKTFFYTYAGTVLSTVWMMILGCVLAVGIPNFLDNASLNIAQLVSAQYSILIYVIIILGILATNVFNLYGAFMSITTILDTFIHIKGSFKNRFLLLFASLTIGTILAIWGNGEFLHNFTIFILFLSYLMFPWTTINLIDYYLLRHGKYDIKALFDLNGEYGKYNWIAIFAYTVSVLVEIPFINSELYIGPIAQALNGVDIAWVVGLTVPLLLYYYPMKKSMYLKIIKAESNSEHSLT